MARRRFFVEAVHRGRAEITGPDAHHLTRVLRVEAGQKFEISDNSKVYLAEVASARKDLVSFSIIEPLDATQPILHARLFVSLIKFERFEWLLEKATELGVDRVTPLETDRSEKGLYQAAGKRLPRWNRIAREASEQSRRARLPEIDLPLKLAEALHCTAAHRYALDEAEAEARPILSAIPGDRERAAQVFVLAGPEGGWTDRERAAITAASWTPVSLGPMILRAETAAIAALAVLNAASRNVID